MVTIYFASKDNIQNEKKSTFFKKNYFCLGIFFVLPCIEKYTKVDLRTSVIDIPPQEVCDQKLKNKFFWVLETTVRCYEPIIDSKHRYQIIFVRKTTDIMDEIKTKNI